MEMKKIICLIFLLLTLAIFINGCNSGDLYIIKDKAIIPADKCSSLDQYSIIYQTGCPHCANVLPRIQQVEQDLNITFKHYNLAIEQDFNKFNELKVMPEGVPCVIINCKAYLGDGYSVEQFKNFVLESR